MASTDTVPVDPVTLQTCTGEALNDAIPDLAVLRVTVFRAWPYLYEGNTDDEVKYLQTYRDSPRAAVIVARQQGRVVGAATCLPLQDEPEAVQAPFRDSGLNVADFFYFGESVLLPGLRGQGVGVRFFEAREAHARAASSCAYACFCGVIRPADHPARPPGWEPLDRFWTRRGFTRRPDLVCQIAWKDAGDAADTPKNMVFWMKSLTGAPLP